MISNNKDI